MNSDIPLVPGDETLIMCINFSHKELKTLLLDKLKVDPIMYYECMLLSPVDKIYEFDDMAIFYNLVMLRDNIYEEPLIIRIIRKDNFAVFVIKELETDTFRVPDQIANKFKFSLVKKKSLLGLLGMKKKKSEQKAPDEVSQSSEEFPEIIESSNNQAELGKIMIQKMKTIKLESDDKVTIDYLLFWLASEGLKKIETLVNEYLLTEVNAIQEQSSQLSPQEKPIFLKKMDSFQNYYISAQNAKESKSSFFSEIIRSDLPSRRFRHLIRHLISRM